MNSNIVRFNKGAIKTPGSPDKRYAGAAVLMSKEEAMEAAFGMDAAIETLPVFIDDAQEAEIQRQVKMKLDSHLFHFFEGRRNGARLSATPQSTPIPSEPNRKPFWWYSQPRRETAARDHTRVS
ncbi:hypothetical protein F6R98_02465 [Candidatus Methylospira mobilis]|uniref:Uncharacterized protein n=1 Tax=Candidatus Methylospira mobilis TaxID=1808979 RepID=A0A5Q0BIH1_9GAMM|nr:hypothetical protein [Candidatus Methylospira mobilis]QFY41626.1 hypothetical protein F6R98_02465 [Candidatus Methylospira mobilis]WNV05123.1 hypothetical protein RP726_01630 [Candidatus Methylospira mobilis]